MIYMALKSLAARGKNNGPSKYSSYRRLLPASVLSHLMPGFLSSPLSPARNAGIVAVRHRQYHFVVRGIAVLV